MKRTNPPRGSERKPQSGNGHPTSGEPRGAGVPKETSGDPIPVRAVSPSGKGSETPSDRIVSPNAALGSPKAEDLGYYREDPEGKTLTTNAGTPVQNDQDSLKAGPRGPSLLEDFHLREKITHFDHERIPERVVHARGSGAHGYFQVYEDLSEITRASFLCDPAARMEIADTVCAVLSEPSFSALFGKGSLAEAPLAATLPDGTVVAGTVDRLLVESSRISVIDFKTGKVPRSHDAIPASHKAQMSAYTGALRVIFPGREVRAALLYTSGPQLFELQC